jgi:hypothetical protein
MNIKDIIIETDNIDWNRILQHWSWLFVKGTTFNVWILTKFADLFVHMDDDSIWRLDTGAGTFDPIAKSKDEFSELIDSNDNFDFWFMPGLISQLESEGKRLQGNQCYGFITPTGFKEGSYSVANIKVCDIEKYFMTMGDLWGRLQDVEDGTKVKLKPAE